jgi:hypothetical protein
MVSFKYVLLFVMITVFVDAATAKPQRLTANSRSTQLNKNVGF